MGDNQHYITKAHLDKFVHPSSGQNILYPYRRGTGARKPTGTKQLGSADHFYRQTEAGELTNKLDEARKASERLFFASGRRTASPLATCVYDDSFLPASEDKIMLAGAAALLRCGSPVQIHNAAMHLLVAVQIDTFNQLAGEDILARYRDKYGDEAEEHLAEHRDKLIKGQLIVDVGEEHWKQLGFESFRTEELWLKALLEMGLTVCDCHYKSFFLTSDNPVVLTTISQPDSPGLGLTDAEVWFPISYKRGLLWTWKHKRIRKEGLGHSQTRALNKRIIKWCYNEVYSPLPEYWIERAIKEGTFDPCYGYYGSLQQIMDKHSKFITNEDGRRIEVVDWLEGLRHADKADVLGMRTRIAVPKAS